jgi:DNA modification methylase
MKVSIESVHPMQANARRHGGRNLGAIKASLQRFGQQKPIVVGPDGAILAGNGTWVAAKALGWPEIEITRSDLVGPEATAYAIADNRTAELAEWDDAILAEALAGLQSADEALAAATGFSPGEIERLMAQVRGITRQADADAIPDPPETAESTPGAVYRLGRHRVSCGDATRVDDVMRLVGHRKVHLLLTDPPYNVAYEGKTAAALKIANDSMDAAAFRQFLTAAFAAADRAMRPGAPFYIWHADTEGLAFRLACQEAAWAVRQCLVWAKQTAVLGRQDYHWRHEPCLYGWKPGASHLWFADRKQTTLLKARVDWHLTRMPDGYCVTIDGATYLIRGDNLTVCRTDTTLLEFDRPSRSTDHPTMKPVALFEYLMVNSTQRGTSVLDPFAGSGTTLLAAERTGRTAWCIELDPRYVDVIRRRWAEFVHGEGCDWMALTPREK